MKRKQPILWGSIMVLILLALFNVMPTLTFASSSEDIKWISGTPVISKLRRQQKLLGKLPPPNFVFLRGLSWNEGDTLTFKTYNFNTNQSEDTPATLRKVDTHCYIWVADDQWPPNGTRLGDTEDEAKNKVETIGTEFDTNIYPNDRTYFGTEPNVDGDPRIHILVFDIKDGYTGIPPNDAYIAGYFDPADQTGQNNLDMFYMDLDPGVAASITFYGTLAHEFQHMIHYNMDTGHDEEDWFNEGLSDYAILVCGYGLPNTHINAFATTPDVALTDAFNNTFEEYGASFLFVEFMTELAERNGKTISDFTKALVDEEDDGINAINDVAPNFLPSEHDNFEKIFDAWVIANYLDSPTGTYGYRYPGLDFSVSTEQVALNPLSNRTHTWEDQDVNSWAADYFEVEPTPSLFDLLLNFNGGISGISPFDDFNDLQVLVIKDGNLVGSPIPIGLNFLNDVNYTVTLRSYDQLVLVISGNDDGGGYDLSVETPGVDVTLVIDRSGSMGWSQPDAPNGYIVPAKNAATIASTTSLLLHLRYSDALTTSSSLFTTSAPRETPIFLISDLFIPCTKCTKHINFITPSNPQKAPRVYVHL